MFNQKIQLNLDTIWIKCVVVKIWLKCKTTINEEWKLSVLIRLGLDDRRDQLIWFSTINCMTSWLLYRLDYWTGSSCMPCSRVTVINANFVQSLNQTLCYMKMSILRAHCAYITRGIINYRKEYSVWSSAVYEPGRVQDKFINVINYAIWRSHTILSV